VWEAMNNNITCGDGWISQRYAKRHRPSTGTFVKSMQKANGSNRHIVREQNNALTRGKRKVKARKEVKYCPS